MTVVADKVKLEKAHFYKGRLFFNRTHEYVVPADIQSKAGSILTKWFNKARLSLRMQGGDVNHPLMKSGWTSARRYVTEHEPENSVLKILTVASYTKEDNTELCPLRDIILKNKIDVYSISIVMQRVRWGDQKRGNVSHRFRTEYKPLLMYALMEGAKLEDS
ncbi:hypothetical protein UFOVP121_15 [uncultured Caudovirales phage]|uniref:Uncharacterized protein n=1 Tax=uncultured Caudovirales phage TaxID=2100421 RepID=A0A6J5LPB0_9CAUD|nr:hypothetical protein UFOVP121_15 [uncultured Caudovirales phage]CAB4134827.1 hypothetical protein UFOVP277_20 [uncultured Caudovirales phage]